VQDHLFSSELDLPDAGAHGRGGARRDQRPGQQRCSSIPDGATCSETATAHSVGQSPFYCVFSAAPGPVASTLGSICVDCGTNAARTRTCLPASSSASP
jgi:hypothetical protein